jgi:hypothetical protein
MQRFQVTVRTVDQTLQYIAIAPSSFSAYDAAAAAQGDAVCAITVLPA